MKSEINRSRRSGSSYHHGASRKVIDELAAQIQKLPRAERVSVLDRLTPHLELEVALERWQARTRSHDAREMFRTVNRVASDRRLSRFSPDQRATFFRLGCSRRVRPPFQTLSWSRNRHVVDSDSDPDNQVNVQWQLYFL